LLSATSERIRTKLEYEWDSCALIIKVRKVEFVARQLVDSLVVQQYREARQEFSARSSLPSQVEEGVLDEGVLDEGVLDEGVLDEGVLEGVDKGPN